MHPPQCPLTIRMLDPKLIRNDLPLVAERLGVRNFSLDTDSLQSLEQKRKALQSASEQLQATRNSQSKLIGQAKSRGEDIEPLLAETSRLGDELAEAKQSLAAVQEELDNILLSLPNIVDASVPAGRDESDNVEVRRVGVPRQFNYEVKDHVDIAW